MKYSILIIFVLILITAFAVLSSPAYSYPAQINFIANPYLNTTGGMYCINLTYYAYDAMGNPAADGTIVNFNIEVSNVTTDSIPTNYTSQYFPIRTGNLNGNNSQYVSVPTSGGKAVVHYGWFPDNKIPSGFVMITAAVNNTPNIKTTLYLIFNGTTQVWWTIVPVMPMNDAPPSAPTFVGTANTTTTPLSSMITLLSLAIGFTIVFAVRRK